MTTTNYERNMVLSSVDYKVVGTRPIRPDGADKVTGRALYGADFDTSGLLHGHVLRSPHAHARIKSIDTSKAEALQGVLAVVTSKDLPHEADESDPLSTLATTCLLVTRCYTKDTRLRPLQLRTLMSPRRQSV